MVYKEQLPQGFNSRDTLPEWPFFWFFFFFWLLVFGRSQWRSLPFCTEDLGKRTPHAPRAKSLILPRKTAAIKKNRTQRNRLDRLDRSLSFWQDLPRLEISFFTFYLIFFLDGSTCFCICICVSYTFFLGRAKWGAGMVVA